MTPRLTSEQATFCRREYPRLVGAVYDADLSVADPASVLGCEEGTVKALTHQALANLRRSGALVEQEVADGA